MHGGINTRTSARTCTGYSQVRAVHGHRLRVHVLVEDVEHVGWSGVHRAQRVQMRGGLEDRKVRRGEERWDSWRLAYKRRISFVSLVGRTEWLDGEKRRVCSCWGEWAPRHRRAVFLRLGLFVRPSSLPRTSGKLWSFRRTRVKNQTNG